MDGNFAGSDTSLDWYWGGCDTYMDGDCAGFDTYLDVDCVGSDLYMEGDCTGFDTYSHGKCADFDTYLDWSALVLILVWMGTGCKEYLGGKVGRLRTNYCKVSLNHPLIKETRKKHKNSSILL